MKVCDIMTRHVVTIEQDDSVLNLLELMDQHRISGVPVVNRRGSLVGIVSKTDLASPAVMSHLQNGASLETLCVRDVGNFGPVITLKETDSVEHTAQVMASHQIHRGIVVNAIGKIIGIVTTFDISRLKASENAPDYDHPDLSDHDRQLLRLLVLHKPVSTIAAIFHTSDEAVYQRIHEIQLRMGAWFPS